MHQANSPREFRKQTIQYLRTIDGHMACSLDHLDLTRDENGGGKFVHGSGGLVLLRAA
ncbi:hypothetical protein SAMN02746000_03856 [Paracoccus sp. J56]|nr:hypothetical protein SAMN02746000_03856 [Paracoccus sp. J56]